MTIAPATMAPPPAGPQASWIAIGGLWAIAGALGPRLRPGPEGVRAAAAILDGVPLGTVAGLPAGALLGELFGGRYAVGAAAGLAAIAMISAAVKAATGSRRNRRAGAG